MYYLDFYPLYKQTTTEQRVVVRQGLRRNKIMLKRLAQQHYQCFYCGIAIDMTAHLDHLIPVYYGGTNRLRNLVAACAPCNLAKSTGQIEITNPYTIKDYLKLQKHYAKVCGRKWANRTKRYQLYRVYRADLFKFRRG